MKTFAERLKYAMGESGLNQSTLSERTGASKAAISQYLSGKNIPGPERVKVLGDAFQVRAEDWHLACNAAFLIELEDSNGQINP